MIFQVLKDKVVVAVISTDFKLAYNVKKAVEGYFIYYHLTMQDNLSSINIVITTREESKLVNHKKVLVLNSNNEASYIKSQIINKLKEEVNENYCIVGVDPGKTIGLAILYMGEILTTNVFLDLNELIFWIKRQLRLVNASKIIFKIGFGENYWYKIIFDRIDKEFSNIAEIKAINEYRTSIRSDNGRIIHEEAAIRIAQRD